MQRDLHDSNSERSGSPRWERPSLPTAVFASQLRWSLICRRCGTTLGVWEFPFDWSAVIAVPSSRKHSGCGGSLEILRSSTPLLNIAITSPGLLSILKAASYPLWDASGNLLAPAGADGSEIQSTST